MKKLYSILVILLFLVPLCANLNATYCAATFDVEQFKNCRKFYRDNNNFGSYIYGYDVNTLYCTRVLPNAVSRQITIEGKIRSVSLSGNCCYALCSQRSFTYCVIKLDIDSGKQERYVFDFPHEIHNESFCVSNGKAYFIGVGADITYVSSYTLSGSKSHDIRVNEENIYKIFSNGNNAYAQTYGGGIYRLGNGNSAYCDSLTLYNEFDNAADGYILDSYGILVSLNGGKTYYKSIAPRCLAKYGNTTVYAENKTVINGDKTYSFNNKIEMLFLYKDKLAVMSNYKIETISLSQLKAPVQEPESKPSVKAAYSINSENVITGVKQGTSVKDFLNAYNNSGALYDSKGNKVTSGKMKTGYRFELNGKSLIVSVTGDISGEGNVKSNDKKLIKDYLIENSTLSSAQLASADFNSDGKVDNRDLVLLARKIKE